MKDYSKIRCLVLALSILLFPVLVQGQASNYSPGQLKRLGKNADKAGNALSAIYFYEKYHQNKPGNKDITYKLANLYRVVNNYNKAKKLYKDLTNDAGKYPLARYYYALMLKSTGEYVEAQEELKKFKKEYKGKKDYKEYSKLIRNELKNCDSAIAIINKPLNVTVEKLNTSINGKHVELSPIPVDDSKFIYASLRVDSLVYFNNNEDPGSQPVRKFYVAKKQGADWIGGKELEGSYNVPGMETGNGVFSRDGNRFYFTRCTRDWQNKMICSIYLSKKKDNVWSEPEKLPPIINDPNYTSTQPALGQTSVAGNEIIYFVSNRPESKGGLDIWYTIWSNDRQQYSKPQNLGTTINTKADDMTPFYDQTSRTLYFSSAGYEGLGGLDIYKATGERRKWSNIENAGYPINSSYDDLYFTTTQSGEDGFMVSNRPDDNAAEDIICCDDILYYRWKDFIRLGVTGVIYPFEKDKYGRKRDLSNFDFMNPPDTIEPLENAVIALYILDEQSNNYTFIDRDTTGKDGLFYFKLYPDKEYEFKMEGFQYFDSKMYLSTESINFSDTIEMPPTWVNVLTDKPVVLENIYYEFNKADLTQNAKRVIDTTLLIMLREAPEFIVEIGAHTDSIGTEEYNKQLSEERASNVVQYLITKGIPSQLLVSKGYGAAYPVAPNYLPDGSDNPEGREKNRRTQFKVVGTITKPSADEEEFDTR